MKLSDLEDADQLFTRFDRLDIKIDRLENKIDARFNTVDAKFNAQRNLIIVAIITVAAQIVNAWILLHAK